MLDPACRASVGEALVVGQRVVRGQQLDGARLAVEQLDLGARDLVRRAASEVVVDAHKQDFCSWFEHREDGLGVGFSLRRGECDEGRAVKDSVVGSEVVLPREDVATGDTHAGPRRRSIHCKAADGMRGGGLIALREVGLDGGRDQLAAGHFEATVAQKVQVVALAAQGHKHAALGAQEVAKALKMLVGCALVKANLVLSPALLPE